MKDGFIKVASATIHTTIANCKENTKQITQMIETAYKAQTKLIVFPELSITGYSCEDLFFQDTLLYDALEGLNDIIHFSNNKDIVIIVGLPYQFQGKLYNVAAVIYNGKLLALVPKIHIPTYNEFYEGRHFTSGLDIDTTVQYQNEPIPFSSQLIFQNLHMPSMSIGIEICEDLWVPLPPSTHLVLNGATIIANLSASNELTGKSDYRRLLIQSHSARNICAYLYASAGSGESTTDVVFSGHRMICENGTILNQSPCFQVGLTYATIDVNKLQNERRKISTFTTQHHYRHIYFDMPLSMTTLENHFDLQPFVPNSKEVLKKRCSEILQIQSEGLKQRLKASNTNKLVIGISGGLDSTLALLVAHRTFQDLKIPTSNIYAITMPCFGTTSRTIHNALGIMKELKVTSMNIDIQNAVLQHFKDIDHDPDLHDLTFENAQARERTQILMDMSNKLGAIVLGTGDLSEIALGWSTYNGDHMSMYGINSSVPKTLIRHLISYISHQHIDTTLFTLLQDILDTPVSPELLPSSHDEIVQITEDIVGPYELHDFFLYHVVRFGYEPTKLFRIAHITFQSKYDDQTILKWLKVFYQRFISQQFKRSCIPDGPKVGSVALSPRGDLRMPSDANYQAWLEALNHLSI